MELNMQPLSGTVVPALNQAQVTQLMLIQNPTKVTFYGIFIFWLYMHKLNVHGGINRNF
jgi:hypothetical protein